MDKRSSLLRTFVNYVRKQFHKIKLSHAPAVFQSTYWQTAIWQMDIWWIVTAPAMMPQQSAKRHSAKWQ